MDLEGQPARDACQRARRRTLNEDGRFSHSYLVRSYNGHYLGLSIRRREFDSPTHRQVLKVDKRTCVVDTCRESSSGSPLCVQSNGLSN